jgi:hypothetical protein
MLQHFRIATAALAAALVMSCSSSEDSTATSGSAACAGLTCGYWSSPSGRDDITQGDLAYLSAFDGCRAFGPFGTVDELVQYLAAAEYPQADAGFTLCAEWFAFALNARHGRFSCGDVDVLFAFDGGHLTIADLEGAVRTALAVGGEAALAAFFEEANGGASVCVCATGATGATGGTGGTGSSGSSGE